MAEWNFSLRKMKTEDSQPINYFLNGDERISLNDLIGSEIEIQFDNSIRCIACGNNINKTYGQGFCYPCFISVPEASDCILRPELCKGHLGEGRDVEWEEKNHVQPHIVYLALSSAIKVGVTRKTQVPFRWFDQGAIAAIPILECPNRYEAGRIEVLLKSVFTDKTSWQKMLKNDVSPDLDLLASKEKALNELNNQIAPCKILDEPVLEIEYPVIKYPEKVKSLKLDKVPLIKSKLLGIKGQYFLLEDNKVINIRSHTGYDIILKA